MQVSILLTSINVFELTFSIVLHVRGERVNRPLLAGGTRAKRPANLDAAKLVLGQVRGLGRRRRRHTHSDDV